MDTHLSPNAARWTLFIGALLFYSWSYVWVPALNLSEYWTSSQTGWRVCSPRPYLAGLIMLVVGRLCCDALPETPWWWVVILVFVVGGGLGHVLWPQFPETFSCSSGSLPGGAVMDIDHGAGVAAATGETAATPIFDAQFTGPSSNGRQIGA